MQSAGENPSYEDVTKLMTEFDKNQSGVIEFEEFIKMIERFEELRLKLFREIFNRCDINKDGKIERSELRFFLIREIF
jgi:Ca2+-binding EF-hand superfamily protein